MIIFIFDGPAWGENNLCVYGNDGFLHLRYQHRVIFICSFGRYNVDILSRRVVARVENSEPKKLLRRNRTVR
jgi:hypothetical protein